MLVAKRAIFPIIIHKMYIYTIKPTKSSWYKIQKQYIGVKPLINFFTVFY